MIQPQHPLHTRAENLSAAKPLSKTLAILSVWSLLLGGAGCLYAIEDGTPKPPDTANLKPGQYVWDAAAANQLADGSVDIVASLGDQVLYVYRDGALIGRSTISSGRQGYETPPGIYMILEKNQTHHSNKYHEASMPYMERLTWGGLAIHAGNTPGHPESHGCMHVPEDFAKDLYGYTQEGNTVLVAQRNNQPVKTSAPNQLFAADGLSPSDKEPTQTPAPSPGASPAKVGEASGSPAPEGGPGFTWDGQKVPNGPYLVVFTSADKRVYAYRKGVEIGQADLGGDALQKPFGGYVYAALTDKNSEGKPEWNLLGRSDDAPTPDLSHLAKGLQIAPGFMEKVRGIVGPGMTLVVTDHPIKPDKAADADKED